MENENIVHHSESIMEYQIIGLGLFTYFFTTQTSKQEA